MKKINIRPIAVTGIMSALGFVLMCLEFPISFLMPSFIQFDFSELPALVTSFAFGPVYGVMVCLVKNILHLSLSKTSGVGELANFILGASFCFVAGYIYKLNKTFKGAIISCFLGALFMALISFPINYFITYPFYYNFMAKEQIIAIYMILCKTANSIPKALLIFNLPFTFVKGTIDSIICILIYKRISPILKSKR